MKTKIFEDIDQINAELKAPRAEAAKIQNLLDLIGEVNAPEGMAVALTGMDLVKDLVAGNIGTGYLRSIMLVKRGTEVLRQAIDKAAFDCNQKGQDLNRFFLNGLGKVEAVEESIVIEDHTYYTENADQEEYIALVQAHAQSWNDLETFLQGHHQPGIASNNTKLWGIDRLEYVFRDENKDYSTVAANLRAVNDFKTV